MDHAQIMLEMGRRARAAAQVTATLSTPAKNAALLAMAEGIKREKEFIQAENVRDVEAGRAGGLTNAMLDRLTLTDAVIESMASGLAEVAQLPDPVGEIAEMKTRPNGLMVGRRRIPLGVIGFIYESRPNVTVDAAGLCLKSGNAVILRGGSEAHASNMAIAQVVARALEKAGVNADAVQVAPYPDRELVNELLRLEEYVDLIIPRGGEGLIRFVAQNSRIPVLKHYKGVCHVYVDESAATEMAVDIAFNSKVHRPGVCNAAETLLVHAAEAETFLPLAAKKLEAAGVELRCCERALAILPGRKPATEADWPAEYLDLILAVRVVDSMDEALAHIAAHGSQHTEAIVTQNHARAMDFLARADSSVVLVNASTRFNDGGQLGLGAEIGISTSKLHAFGPMGLNELTTTKFVVFGQGQVRA